MKNPVMPGEIETVLDGLKPLSLKVE
jgi:hypothetical protein